MNHDPKNSELFRTSHVMILVCYTIFSIILMVEMLLLSWEQWAMVLITAGVVIAWMLHFRQTMDSHARLWIYSLLMMATFFFYGIHRTSTFDLAAVMGAIIMLYTMTGIKSLIRLCQVTFFLSFFFDIAGMLLEGETFDLLSTTRILLHGALIIMAGWISRSIIDSWGKVLGRSHEEIEELRDATMRLNSFLANVSHEIRTPVNAVTGLTAVCMEKEENEEIRKDMEAVRAAGKRIGEQISDILDFTEIDSGRLRENREDYMLSSVMHDLMTELAPLRKLDIELVIDVDPAIPMILNSDVGKLKTILRHLIKNALKYTKNGGAYMRMSAIPEEYGINLCIEVTDTGIGISDGDMERVMEGFYQGESSRTQIGGGLGLGLPIVSGFVTSLGGFMTIKSKEGEGTTVRVSLPQKVVDPKSCISLTNKGRLCLGAYIHFEKFSNTNIRVFYNTMMKNVVKGFGVQIHRVDSLESLQELCGAVNLTHLLVGQKEYEADSAFMEKLADKMLVIVAAGNDFVPLPSSKVILLKKPVYCFPLAEMLNMNLEDRGSGTERLLLKGVRALVVDDEPMNLVVAKEVLKRYQMETDTAVSGFEAVEMCKAAEYDLVFMDHMMPGMDGIEAMKRIRAGKGREGRDLPMVALTANAVSTAKEMFLSEGFDGFVSKPIELNELERVLKKVLPKKLIEYISEDEFSAKASSPQSQQENAEMQESPSEDNACSDVLSACGIDTETGIQYCGMDEEFYQTVLLQFAEDSRKKGEDLAQALQNGDDKDYEIRVHGLKSSAKMIGALALSELAKELEKDASEHRIDLSKHENLMEMYRKTVEAIRAFAGETLGFAENGSSEEIFEFEAGEGNF
ncbi:MAG: response regulator [Lachnospiraceae bacterium]|nr:response regulator [Lachnospiraceae bacterium]